MAAARKFMKLGWRQDGKRNYGRMMVLSFSAALFPFGFAQAEQVQARAAYLTEEDFLADVPMVLGASRLPQRAQDAPAATIVIDRQTIEASGVTNVADVMRLVPGMYVGYFKGHAPTVALHGLTGEYSSRMQVLIDGRSVYNSLIGSVEWNDIPLLLDDIERIEVVRGPNAAAFGANAFMGVINIISRDASLTSTSAKLALGDNGQRRLMGRYSGHGGAWNYRLSAGYRADDGISDVYDSQAQKIVDLRADYRPNSRDTLAIGLGHNDSRRDRGSYTAQFDQPHPDNIQSSYGQLRWSRVIGADREISAQLYHNKYYLEGRTTTLPVPQLGNLRFAIGGELDLARSDFEVQFRFAPTADWRLVAGGGFRRDSALSDYYLGTTKREVNDTSRVFAHGEWSATPKLNLNFGAMLEDTSYTGREFSPRVALNYRLMPNHALRASRSRAHRTPTIYEEKADNHFDLVPPTGPKIRVQQNKATGGLMSEHIVSHELGYVGHFVDQGIMLDLRAYYDKLDHLVGTSVISPFSAPGYFVLNNTTFSSVNKSEAKIKGYETHVRYRPDASIDVFMSYASTRISSDDPALERTMPRNTFSLLATRQLPDRMQGSVGYYQLSSVEPLSEGNLIPLARRLDLRLAYRLERSDGYFREGEAALVLQNLLGKYADFERANIAQQRAYASLELRW
ncbi:MAG: TonB-dependent receptor [Burkholderiales bacterium]